MTDSTSKALLEVGGVPLIQRSVDILYAHGIKDISVVVGYQRDQIQRLLGDSVNYIVNEDFANTNNMASMALGREAVDGEPFLYLHGDLWYHPEIIGIALGWAGEICFLVEKKSCGEEEMKVRVESGLVTEADKSIPLAEAYGEWLGIVKFGPDGASVFFDQVEKTLVHSKILYDCAVVRDLAARGTAIHCMDIGRLPWVEIDFAEDLAYARALARKGAA